MTSKDKQYEIDQLKEIFYVNGKIRRIFPMKIKKKKKKKKFQHFYIIVFKNENSLLRCFDIEKFQYSLLQKYSHKFQKMTNFEKEIHF